MNATPITADSPLNLWLANTQVQVLRARLQAVESILRGDVASDAAKVREALAVIDRLWLRLERAGVAESYEDAVAALMV